MKSTSFLLLLSSALPSALAGSYKRAENIVGADFFHAFDFQAIPDPTHGRVNYTDEATARALGLAYASPGRTFTLRSDDTTVLDPNGPGRNSVRMISKNDYTTHVAVFDMTHMPQGCGTWPAVWEFGGTWPIGGEVDIVEGVNDQGTDQSTLHTGPNCTMPAWRPETGTPTLLDCDGTHNFNAGCGVKLNEPTSYGPTFNTNKGGWYAIERTNDFIAVWFWARDDERVPSDVVTGGWSVCTDNWGTPAAYFPNDSCDLADWAPHNIIINLTFCGDWAGNPSIYAESGCPSTCIDYVNNNPTAFTEAFFEFKSINTYTITGSPYPYDV